MAEKSDLTTGRQASGDAARSALVRRCDLCGIINACDLDATPAGWKQLQLPDHTVMKVTETEAMELWKDAGRCDHKKYIEELRAQIRTPNVQSPSERGQSEPTTDTNGNRD